MRSDRFFEIIYILLNKSTATARELAERFEVSERTIYRDIDILSSAGIPIYASQGKGGGISLLGDYVLDKSILTEKEQEDILFALQSLSTAQDSDTEKVLSKLSDFFKKDPAGWLEVDLSPWGSEKKQTGEFAILKDAILKHHVLEFKYINALSENSMRKVEPVKILFKERTWYLQGYCLMKNAPRTFRVSRMHDVIDTQEIFQERETASLSTSEKNQSHSKYIGLTLRIFPHGAYRVYDEFDKKDIQKNQDGSFTIETSLPAGEWILNYLFSFGTDLEVISPEEIRSALKNSFEKLLERYNK